MFGKMMKQAAGALDKAKEAVHNATAPKKGDEEPAAAAEAAAEEPVAEEKVDDGSLGEEKAREIATKIREAIAGAGTDEKALVEALCPLTHKQSEEVKAAYTALGHDLKDDITNDTSGNFERVLVGLITTPGDACANTARKAMGGLGCDEKLLTEAICLSSDQTLRDAVESYRKLHDRILLDDIESETSGTLRSVLTTTIRAALADNFTEPTEEEIDTDVIRLYKAGEDKIGTNEGVFVDVLCSKGENHRQIVATAYAKKHGKSLVKVVKSEFGGDAERALLYLVRDTAETFAHILHDAMAGVGTDEDTLIRVLTQQRHQLKAVNEHFLKEFEKTLERWVESEVSGDLEDALRAICATFSFD